MKTRSISRYLRNEGYVNCSLLSIPTFLLWESVIVECVKIVDLARLYVAFGDSSSICQVSRILNQVFLQFIYILDIL